MWDIPGLLKAGLEVTRQVLTRLWPAEQTKEEAVLLNELMHWEEEYDRAMRPPIPDAAHASFARERMRLVRAKLQAINNRKG